ncbi:MAG: hypothetical protein QOI01_4217, partial [Mycobacterium sp.]|nr:hypothetical protein [Mycobacterium sp.]
SSWAMVNDGAAQGAYARELAICKFKEM